MDEFGLARILLEVVDGRDEAAREAQTLLPGPDCLSLPRFRSALLRDDWTEAEMGHRRGCSCCQRTEELARVNLWHPGLWQLFRSARALPGGDDADLLHHLQKDRCTRCARLSQALQVDRFLGRFAAAIRQGLADVQKRVEAMLHAAWCLPTTRSATQLLPATGEGTNLAPSLYRWLLVGKDRLDGLALIGRENDSANSARELTLDIVPADASLLLCHPVDLLLLQADDAPILQARMAADLRRDPALVSTWKSWATTALKTADLAGPLRSMLETVTRSEAGPRLR